jgi:hypothetical protein
MTAPERPRVEGPRVVSASGGSIPMPPDQYHDSTSTVYKCRTVSMCSPWELAWWTETKAHEWRLKWPRPRLSALDAGPPETPVARGVGRRPDLLPCTARTGDPLGKHGAVGYGIWQFIEAHVRLGSRGHVRAEAGVPQWREAEA